MNIQTNNQSKDFRSSLSVNFSKNDKLDVDEIINVKALSKDFSNLEKIINLRLRTSSNISDLKTTFYLETM